MINLICATNTAGNIVIYVVLIFMLIAMLVLPYFTQRKKNKEFLQMIESMKVGDLVKTAGGIIGRITKITDKGDIKTVILETGSKSEKSYMEFDMSMIYCVLKSTKVAEEETSEKTEEKVEEKVEEKATETKVEEKTEEKPVKKTPAKKSTAKKTTAKKTTAKKAE